MPRRFYKTDYETGQDNISLMGLDVHNPVFFLAAVGVIGFIGATLIMPDQASAILLSTRDWVLATFDWLFVSSVNLVFLFCLVIIISPLGRLRIGGSDAKPEFSTKSWFAMLFSAGIGIGLMFWGAAEPLAYYTGWFGTPFGVEPLTDEARDLSLSATMFHWGGAMLGLSMR